MNIPLDKLYHYIENICEKIYGDRIIIYRFWPHGSKNINDLHSINSDNYVEKATLPLIWCNDQEPLSYDFYRTAIQDYPANPLRLIFKSLGVDREPKNLNHYRDNVFEKSLLIHSEKRSVNLEKYKSDNELIPVYYWSHAVIARDWFRYAEHVTQRKQVNKIFLIYNRAWSGTREYRLHFLELLVRSGLQNNCQTSVNAIEPELGIHYDLHKFKNPVWRPSTVLENFFPTNTAQSHYSADFDIKDYEATDIEIVLETLFDDDRLHLTEKSLRPIACAQPFILVGTQGSLEYLSSYGFKTFSSLWDESYDLIEDPKERLNAVVDLMNQIKHWLPHVRERKMAEACAIAEYNRQHFFSQEFFNLVTNELKTNLKSAFDELELGNNYTAWIERWSKLITYPEVNEFLRINQNIKWPTVSQVKCIMELAQNKIKGGTL
jgi:hypothetical protein